MNESSAAIKKILKNASLRITGQRIEILKILLNTTSHPRAEDIYTELKERFPVLSFSTVYKILDVFVQKGIVKKLHTSDHTVHYDADMSEHHHLVSKNSKKIIDFRDEELLKIVKDYFRQKQISDFEIDEIQINILGNTIN